MAIRTPKVHNRMAGERTTDDLDTILRLLADTVPPPVMYADDVADLIGHDTEYVKIDDDGHVCRITVTEDKELKVNWLLPRGPSRDIMTPVMAAALTAVIADRPEAKGWRLYATFTDTTDKGKELCLAWQEKVPGTTVSLGDDGDWEIAWTLEETERSLTSVGPIG